MGMCREYGGMTVVDDHANIGYDWMLEKQTRPRSCTRHSRTLCSARKQEKSLQRLNDFDLDFNLLDFAIDDLMFNAFLLPCGRHHNRVGLHVIVRPCAS